jgi:hypothetical protein
MVTKFPLARLEDGLWPQMQHTRDANPAHDNPHGTDETASHKPGQRVGDDIGSTW